MKFMQRLTSLPKTPHKLRTYIRPTSNEDGMPNGFALCLTNAVIIMDGEILAHFGMDYTGKEIREAAAEFYDSEDCIWGNAIPTTI